MEDRRLGPLPIRVKLLGGIPPSNVGLPEWFEFTAGTFQWHGSSGVLVDLRNVAPGTSITVTRRVGFPVEAFEYHFGRTSDRPDGSTRSRSWGVAVVKQGRFVVLLPYAPILPNALLNVLFWGCTLCAMWTGLRWGFGATRRVVGQTSARRRVARGLCPRCEYPVAPNGPCPECGTPHPHPESQ